MKTSKISPSLMCADFTKICDVLRQLEECNTEYLHIDVMDGVFVPNFMLCDGVTKQFRPLTNIAYDYHLMVSNPENKIDWFDIRPNDLVSVHWESAPNIHRTLQKIRSKGAKAGIALNPITPICVLEYLLDDIDFVLVMTVNPGFAGQALIQQTLQKIKDVRDFLDSKGYNDVSIQVDGCVSLPNAKVMRQMGADIFVAGTSSLFKKDLSIADGMAQLREAIK